ncbi:MAG: hypothetical protein K2Y16_01755 [Burkholderiales bacterium]|nr:hypothetical protein [Burkholderiales bacterium]
MAEIRISMSSVFDDTQLEGFRWPLHPFDELERIVESIAGLLRECRISDVRIAEAVFSDGKPLERPRFIGAADCDRLARGTPRH